MPKHVYGVYGTSWTDEQGNLWYRIYGDEWRHDTLWTIAEHFYGSGTQYPIIYNLNKDKIADPHWIYPDHVILIKKGTGAPTKKVDPPAPPPKPADPPKWDGNYMEDQATVSINKIEYVLGVYDTEIKTNQYDKNSCLILNPKFDSQNVREISLNVDEYHPTVDANYFKAALAAGKTPNDVLTSTEYYVSIGDSWRPILPKNIDRIKNELLFVTNGKAKLRFKADASYDTTYTRIYKDGILVPNSRKEWAFDTDKQTIILYKYTSSSAYTIDYVPTKDTSTDPTVIKISENDIKQKLVNITEVFEKGTDSNFKISLSYSPYINSEIIGSTNFDPNNYATGINGSTSYPVKVSVSKANFIDKNKKVITDFSQNTGDGKFIHLKNVTDYSEKSAPALNSFDASTNPYIEFYQSGKDVFLSEPFKYGSDIDNKKNGVHGEGVITVSYQYPTIEVKLKVICRRTTDLYDKYLTPTINSIRVDAKSVK